MGSDDLLIVAGEASGDLHGARLLHHLVELRPNLCPFGLGGDELQGAGLECLAHSSEISVIGITEALKILPRARQIFRQLVDEVDRRQASAAILIDFPEFNLRLAKALKERGLKVIYYISPQVWAWRQGRVKTIAKLVDKMLVVFPFEEAFYRRHGVEAIHVGHPLVDEVPQIPQVWDSPGAGDGPFQVALLPGSRNNEVERILPIMLSTARLLVQELPVRFTLIKAPTIPEEKLAAEMAACEVQVDIVSHHRFNTVAASHLALCAAGTATLEVGLLGTPMVVLHRVAVWSYLVGRIMVRLSHASLVNLLLEREAVPELLQGQAKPARICRQAVELLTERDKINAVRASLRQLRHRIGDPGASRRAALEVSECLAEPATPGVG